MSNVLFLVFLGFFCTWIWDPQLKGDSGMSLELNIAGIKAAKDK